MTRNSPEYMKQYHADHPEDPEKKRVRTKDYYDRNKALVSLKQKAKTYGITLEQAAEMDAVTNCSLCSVEFSITTRKYIDHDHNTGLVRDVVCNRCNTGLHYAEDLAWLELATAYLIRHNNR